MNTVLTSTSQRTLPISLRIVRVMVSVVLSIAIYTDMTLSGTWTLALSGLAIYTFVTAVLGEDPIVALLRRTNSQVPGHALDVVAQVECLAIGLICFVTGIVRYHPDSLIFLLLPFFGIYPIVLCIVRHDLLGYLLQSYRNDLPLKKNN